MVELLELAAHVATAPKGVYSFGAGCRPHRDCRAIPVARHRVTAAGAGVESSGRVAG
jgi:hypothetical protein